MPVGYFCHIEQLNYLCHPYYQLNLFCCWNIIISNIWSKDQFTPAHTEYHYVGQDTKISATLLLCCMLPPPLLTVLISKWSNNLASHPTNKLPPNCFGFSFLRFHKNQHFGNFFNNVCSTFLQYALS
jgi:hypothetical protein